MKEFIHGNYGVWMRSEERMDKKTSETGESTDTGQENPGSGAETEIHASGDAIVIADAILTLAASFREVATAIRNATNTEEEPDDDDNAERYLDGSRVKK